MQNVVFNWSGGKDSSLALYHLQKNKDLSVKYLFTSVNEVYQRISMHGVRVSLLKEQANGLNIPLKQLLLPENPSMETYENLMQEEMKNFKQEGLTHFVFGDIFLEDLKNYRIAQLKKVEMSASFPLWKRDTRELIYEFIDLGFKAITVCVDNRYLDQSFVGRVIDGAFVESLPPEVDPCGENGEFHTFVFDGPIFSEPIHFEIGEIVKRSYPNPSTDEIEITFDFCDLMPDKQS